MGKDVMVQVRRLYIVLLGGCLTFTGCFATGTFGGQGASPPPTVPALLAPPVTPAPAVNQNLPAVPATLPEDRPLPINLPTALQLANVQAVDVAAAAERIRVAAAVLEQAQVLWLPTVTVGGDYARHDGRQQDSAGNVFDNSRSSLMFGLGTGIGTSAVLNVDDAIFAPLAARQQLRARQADRQTASNDTLVAVSDAYFNIQQARGELAGAIAATQRTEDLVRRTKKLAPALVPELETDRAEAELVRRQQAELFARERWKVASAELLRVLRMDPSAQVEPMEPPHLRVELIALDRPVDDLIPIGLTNRPELASQQAQVQVTLTLLKQERLRPLIPSILLRGFSTPVTGTLAEGVFGGGPNSTIANGGLRSDLDLQVLWQFDNLGFGNRAKVHQREAENRLAVIDLFRIQDRVAAEVVQAFAQAQLAARRVDLAEKGVRSALNSADKNLVALGQTKGAGNQVVTLVRPQEAVVAVQALAQAYTDYYGAVADTNRAQFRLYRALGQPAQYVVSDQQAPTLYAPAILAPTMPTGPAVDPLPAPRLLPADAGKGASNSRPQ
jgi:outer membrane protein TolC